MKLFFQRYSGPVCGGAACGILADSPIEAAVSALFLLAAFYFWEWKHEETRSYVRVR